MNDKLRRELLSEIEFLERDYIPFNVSKWGDGWSSIDKDKKQIAKDRKKAKSLRKLLNELCHER